MDLIMLGTGNALVTECYNTCFVLKDQEKLLLVDGGGGSEILHRLKLAGISWNDVHEIFVTHKHIDHLMGIVWMVRVICQNMRKGEYEGDATIYAHDEVIALLQQLCDMLLLKNQTKFIGKRVHFVAVEDGEERMVMGHKMIFFDIHSTKDKQFGFTMDLNEGKKLTCCGDEPYNESEEAYAKDSTWLLHEAFCLYSQADKFKPYEKHHSTVKDACQLAQQLEVKNLLLYHTEDKNIRQRKALYMAEGQPYYTGNLFVPDDMETIVL
ncbi:MAG: MBL fold metallo-hydrolase [Lachnospiraceae bacterium]